MLESAWILLLNSLLLMLRIAPGDSFPRPLSREKEREYLERWMAGDLEARNLLVEHNLRLVAHIIKKYYQNDDADDLISIGSIGLIKGVNTYRPDKGVRLATYASRCIENATLSLWTVPLSTAKKDRTAHTKPRGLFRIHAPVSARSFSRIESISASFCSGGQGRLFTSARMRSACTWATRSASCRLASSVDGADTLILTGALFNAVRLLTGASCRSA